MKNRVINIFLKLMAVAVASVTLSCSKVEITSRMYEPEYFCSAYSDGVSTYYYMNCYISNVVNVNFFKKEMVKIGETTVVIGDYKYTEVKDTAIITSDNYRFARDEFKEILLNNKERLYNTSIIRWEDKYIIRRDVYNEMLDCLLKK